MGLILLMELAYKRLGILKVIKHTLPAGLLLLGEGVSLILNSLSGKYFGASLSDPQIHERQEAFYIYII